MLLFFQRQSSAQQNYNFGCQRISADRHDALVYMKHAANSCRHHNTLCRDKILMLFLLPSWLLCLTQQRYSSTYTYLSSLWVINNNRLGLVICLAVVYMPRLIVMVMIAPDDHNRYLGGVAVVKRSLIAPVWASWALVWSTLTAQGGSCLRMRSHQWNLLISNSHSRWASCVHGVVVCISSW